MKVKTTTVNKCLQCGVIIENKDRKVCHKCAIALITKMCKRATVS